MQVNLFVLTDWAGVISYLNESEPQDVLDKKKRNCDRPINDTNVEGDAETEK